MPIEDPYKNALPDGSTGQMLGFVETTPEAEALGLDMYRFIIQEIRDKDAQEGNLFLKRFLEGPQQVWSDTHDTIFSIKDLWSAAKIPAKFLKHLKRIVGWTPDTDDITGSLDDSTLRRLIAASGRLWKERGTEDALEDVLRLVTGARLHVVNYFDYRWVVEETGFGHEYDGSDPWIIELSTGEHEFNVRIVDDGTLDRAVVRSVARLMRPANERIDITYLAALDQFTTPGDTSQWAVDNGELTVADGIGALAPMLYGESGFTVLDFWRQGPSGNLLQGSTTMTRVLVVRVNAIPKTFQYLYADGSGNTAGWSLRAGSPVNTIYASIGGTAGATFSPGRTITADDIGRVLVIVVTFDGTTVRQYVNGAEVGSGAAFAGTFVGASNYFGLGAAVTNGTDGASPTQDFTIIGAAASDGAVMGPAEVVTHYQACRLAGDVMEFIGVQSLWSKKREGGFAVDQVGSIPLLKFGDPTEEGPFGSSIDRLAYLPAAHLAASGDYLVSARLRGDGVDRVGIGVLRTDGDYYALAFTPGGGWEFGVVLDGAWFAGPTLSPPELGPPLANVWYGLRLQVTFVPEVGLHFKGYVDGIQVVDFLDSGVVEGPVGPPGFFHLSGATVECDEIEVLRLPSEYDYIDINQS